MELPIDGRTAPFRDKYIDSETPMTARWIVFGRDPQDGTYQISNGTDDVLVGLTKQQAEDIVALRGFFVDGILALLNGAAVSTEPPQPIPGSSLASGDSERQNLKSFKGDCE